MDCFATGTVWGGDVDDGGLAMGQRSHSSHWGYNTELDHFKNIS
jgi:hypothetical protein